MCLVLILIFHIIAHMAEKILIESRELTPIKEKPTFVFLDLDGTVLFKNDTPEAVKTRVRMLNNIARYFNICYIPLTQRGVEFIQDPTRNYKEFLNLEWYKDGQSVKCPLFLCEMGGEALIRKRENDSTFETVFANEELEIFSRRYKPSLETLAADMFGDAITIEPGHEISVGIQLTEAAIKKYGYVNIEDVDVDILQELDLSVRENFNNLKPDQRAKELMRAMMQRKILEGMPLIGKSKNRGKHWQIPFMLSTAGSDIDINPLDFADGKLIGVNFALSLLKSKAEFSHWQEYATKKNCQIVDDKEEFAGLAALDLFAHTGNAVAPGYADEPLLGLMKRFKGKIARSKRISSLAEAMITDNSTEIEKKRPVILAVGETAIDLLNATQKDSAGLYAHLYSQEEKPHVWRQSFLDISNAIEELIPIIKNGPQNFIGTHLVVSVESLSEEDKILELLTSIDHEMNGIKYPQFTILILVKDQTKRFLEVNDKKVIYRLCASPLGPRYFSMYYPGPFPNSNGVVDALRGFHYDAIKIALDQ